MLRNLWSEKSTFIGLMIFAYFYSMILAPKIAPYTGSHLLGKINLMHESCLWDTSNIFSTEYNNLRGSDYFIGSMDKRKEKMLNKCLLTFWGLTHLIFYTIVAYMCPNYVFYAFITGCVFEFYEYQVYKCHDILDIFWNTMGLGIGMYAAS